MSLLNTIRTAQTFAARKPLELGDYPVVITEAVYGEGQTKGKYRILFKVQVTEGEFAGSLANVYASFPDNQEQVARGLKPFVSSYLAAGGSEGRLEQDAESLEEVGANLASAMTVGIRKGAKYIGTLSIRANSKDESKPWKNFVFPDATEEKLEMPVADEATKAAFAAASAPATAAL